MTFGREIQAVLFDYGMVLSGPPNLHAWARLRDLTGLGEAELQRHYWTHRHAYDRGEYTGESYFQQLGLSGGTAPFSEGTIRLLLETDTDLWTDLNQPMLDWAMSLQRRGIRTGILSNLGDAMQAGVLERFAWIDAFAHCTWSHALKLAKPEPAIYQHAAEGLKTSPEHILFVDDKRENTDAAVAAGMQAVQYSDHAAFLQEMRSRGFEGLL